MASAARPLLAVLALAAGAGAAWGIVWLLPASGGDVERARELGIVSASILRNHSKSAESLAYFAAMAGGIAVSVAVWSVLARGGGPEPRPAPKPVRPLELALVAVGLFLVFGRVGRLQDASAGPWAVLSEEGEMLAWVDTVLRGGALSLDTFCLYGPLSIWPVAVLFRLFGPSIALWRGWIFAAGSAGLVATYLLLRGLLRTRTAAIAAVLFIGVFCSATIPGMTWSPSRVGLGLGALACLCRSDGPHARRWLVGTGVLLGAALLYSQEVGAACSVGVAAALALRADRASAFAWVSVGGAALLAPAVGYIALQGALAATIDNLFLFPRVRMLGFGAMPFPPLEWTPFSLCAYLVPALLGVSGTVTAIRLLAGERSARVATELALFVFGVLLFGAALSRPDEAHFSFAAPPAFVLLAGLVEDAAFRLAARGVPLAQRVAAASAIALAVAAFQPYWGWIGDNLSALTRARSSDYRALELERGGRVLVPPQFAFELESVVTAVRGRTAPDEPIWVFPNDPLIYFLADRPQATHYAMTLFAATRAQREEMVAQLERVQPRYTVVNRYSDRVDGIRFGAAFPELGRYFRDHYELDADFGSFALFRRKT